MRALIISVLIVTFYLYGTIINAVTPNSNKIWYFGNHAGIDFNTTTPSILMNSSLSIYDNASVICDDSGQLLFYTDGVTVWNRNHNIMPNGNNLMGSYTGGQTAIIIPRPVSPGGQSRFYYIFTVPEYATSAGLRFSIVDMTLDSGMGNITTKNTLLYTPSCEKLAAIYNSNDNSYWLISHQYGLNNKNFLCHKISQNGLNVNPVINTIGSPYQYGTYGGRHAAMGQLVISDNGSRIADVSNYSGDVQVFDFDINTGLFSNPMLFHAAFSALGLAFSPNANYLYVSSWAYDGYINQFSLQNYNQLDITSSRVVVGVVTQVDSLYDSGYMKLAPDGKIYIARFGTNYLATINDPDLSGIACNFNDQGFNLGSGISNAGLVTDVLYPGFITGIKSNGFNSDESQIYPNPSINHLTINIDWQIDNSTQIIFYDLLGNVFNLPISENDHSFEIKTTSVKSGKYFYNIYSDKNITQGSFIVQ